MYIYTYILFSTVTITQFKQQNKIIIKEKYKNQEKYEQAAAKVIVNFVHSKFCFLYNKTNNKHIYQITKIRIIYVYMYVYVYIYIYKPKKKSFLFKITKKKLNILLNK